jgi:deoxyribodipyrimidine photolyase-like uncharacterized protein
MYSHLVVASKFSMPPIVHSIKRSLCTYELSSEFLGIIHDLPLHFGKWWMSIMIDGYRWLEFSNV